MGYKEDPEGNKLKDLPAIGEMVKVFDYGIAQYEKRSGDVKLFNECIKDAKVANTAAATKLIDEFTVYKKQVMAELLTLSDPELQDEKIKEYHTGVAKL